MTMLASYRNGGYEVSILADGTKIRQGVEPTIPPRHPESLDVKITDWCDAGCAWCHEGSTRRGRHAELPPLIDMLTTLPPGVEIALGGGDALSHPGFEELVLRLRRPAVTAARGGQQRQGDETDDRSAHSISPSCSR